MHNLREREYTNREVMALTWVPVVIGLLLVLGFALSYVVKL